MDRNINDDRYTLNQETKNELTKYPNLKKYVEHYVKANGKPEKEGCISNLVYYFKLQCLNHNLDEETTFGWDQETSKDFYSWGTNSRWANTFDAYVYCNFQQAVNVGIYLAENYGDINVDKE